jgi:CDP-paratose 2-epimerase
MEFDAQFEPDFSRNSRRLASSNGKINSPMRVLITGICGFVGSTLARGFREGWPDWELVGLDNFVRAGSETNRLALRQAGVKIVHADIRNPSDLEILPRCDWIIDAAANPSVLAGVDGLTSSRQLVEHNLAGTINLLELAKTWRAGVIILSTSRVYSIRELSAIPAAVQGQKFVPRSDVQVAGFSPEGVAEDFSTAPPISLYGATKLASETLALEYGHTFDLPVFINRCGVLAGAGQFGRIDQGIFSFWIHSYVWRRPLKYIGFGGTGHQVRDCLHARDLLPLLAAQIGNPRRKVPGVLNVSGGVHQSASLRELSAWCAERFGEHTVTAEKASRPFDVPWLVLNSSRAEQFWNWKPQTPLEEIWNEIAAHAEKNPNWLEMVSD